MPPSSVHFNGSVNLPDAETVMSEISSRIPAGVRRMTDGETGERNYWIMFQIQKFLAMPELESVGAGHEAYDTGDTQAPAMPQLRLAQGVAPETVEWPDLGYADAYGQSYEVFRAFQADGTIVDEVRFQMQYPTPLAPIAGTIVPEDLGVSPRHMRPRCLPTLIEPWPGCPTIVARCSGMLRSKLVSWREALARGRRRHWMRSRPA